MRTRFDGFIRQWKSQTAKAVYTGSAKAEATFFGLSRLVIGISHHFQSK